MNHGIIILDKTYKLYTLYLFKNDSKDSSLLFVAQKTYEDLKTVLRQIVDNYHLHVLDILEHSATIK